MSRQVDRYFDRLMHEYYMVGINTFDKQVKEAAKFAIRELTKLGNTQRADETFLRNLEQVINQKLGEDFAHEMYNKTRTFTDITYRLSTQEDQFKRHQTKVKLNANDHRIIEMIKKQNVFWLQNYYSGDVSKRFQDLLVSSIENGWSNQTLAGEMKSHFSDLVKGSEAYFKGLAEHTGLRVREFSRLTAYKKCGVTHYQIHAVIDERTSEICLALDGKIFSIEPALNTMEEMLEPPDYSNPEKAKERLKEIAPFADEKNILTGEHVQFPPFHWRCRTRTVMV